MNVDLSGRVVLGVCNGLITGIVGSNPTEGMDGHLLCLLCW